MKATIEALKQANRLDIACAMLAGLGSFSGLVAATWAVMSQDRQFAVIPFGMVSIWLGLVALRYMAYALGYHAPTEVEADQETDQDNEAGQPESDQTGIEYQQDLLDRQYRLYEFIYGVVNQGKFGEGVWAKEGCPAAYYRTNRKLLLDYRIITFKDGQHHVRVGFQEALKIIASHTNDPENFWTEVQEKYALKINPGRATPLPAEGITIPQ